MSYQFSAFHNDNDSVTWSNPFFPVVPGANTGQLALAPDNQFQQLRGTRATTSRRRSALSADIAYGRMTQNEAYLAPTVNAILAPTVPALPVSSLDGRVDTFNGGVKLTAAPTQGLRITASYDRDRRDNQTPIKQLSDGHDRHVRGCHAAQQHAVQLHVRPLQADRRLRRRAAGQHAADRGCRAGQSRAQLPGGRHDARDDDLGQGRRAAGARR